MRRTCTIFILAIFLLTLACGKSGPPASSLPADDKHKLYQAAMNTRDPRLLQQVEETLGLSDSNGRPTPAFDPFIKEHPDWSSKNLDFVRQYIAPDKAKEYVKSHMP